MVTFSPNPRKEITKSRKIYFWDTGIRNALLKTFAVDPMRPDIGPLWENLVVAEFAKVNLLSGQKQNLFYWRSRGSGEVDLVVTEGQARKAYEIKWRKQKPAQRAFEDRYKTPVQVIDSSAFLQEINFPI